MVTEKALNRRLLDAHDSHDTSTLIDLYQQAADLAEAASHINEACFFLTQAYVFALETNSPQLENLHNRLRQYGRV